MNVSKISTKEKREFLNKLQSGKFMLKSDHVKAEDSKNFDRLDNGLYRCKETGEELSQTEINTLKSSFDICLSLVNTHNQTAGLELADGYQFINIDHSDEKLERLLIPKN